MKALLSVSFGTSHESARRAAIEAVEDRLRAEFPDLPFYSAWTSGRIIEKVRRDRGEMHDTVDQAFSRMAADGVDEAVVSTTCLMSGAEMGKVTTAAAAWSAVGHVAHVAKPLLADEDDCLAVARCIYEEFAPIAEDDAAMFMGHGSKCGSNDAYARVEEALHGLGLERFFVATVEGDTSFEDVWPRVCATGARRVLLAPLMIVAGDHAVNDLAGNGADSWASKVVARGLHAQCIMKGLGEYAGVRDLVIAHVREVLAE